MRSSVQDGCIQDPMAKDNSSTPSNVKVVVRIRPENAKEGNLEFTRVVHAMNEHVLVFDPKDSDSSYYHSSGMRKNIGTRRHKDLKFAFDYVFGGESQNREVYEQTTKVILDGLLNGYNCSVFAYGATGAGKTHTMLGNEEQAGVIFLTMMDLYDRINEMKEEKTCTVAVSYLEVYNEAIKDLLMPSGPLPIREDPKAGVTVKGLTLHKPNNAEELIGILNYGNKNRTQHPTDANSESSRSHAVFQVFIQQTDRTANLSTSIRKAKMCLVDLAGSERATVTANRGARLREGANINRSLLALGNVINALADNKRQGHIPYRDSKLTRLLKDSLGGNCRTVMIANVSPSTMSYEDSYNTLKYADRAKHIKATLKKNILSVDFHVSQYGKIVAELRKEISELKLKVAQYEEGGVATNNNTKYMTPRKDEVLRLQDVLHNVFRNRTNIRKELLEYECSQRDLEWKIFRKERMLTRLDIVSWDTTKNGQSTEIQKIQRAIDSTKTRMLGLQKRKEVAVVSFQENSDWLKRVDSEMTFAGGDKTMPEVLQISLRTRNLELELGDSRRCAKHLKKLVRYQEQESQISEKLLLAVLKMAKHQFFVLKGHNIASPDLVEEYESIQRMVGSDREVLWSDREQAEKEDETRTQQGRLDYIIDFPVLKTLDLTPMTPSRQRVTKKKDNDTPTSCLSKAFAGKQHSWAQRMANAGDAQTVDDKRPASAESQQSHSSNSSGESYRTVSQLSTHSSDSLSSGRSSSLSCDQPSFAETSRRNPCGDNRQEFTQESNGCYSFAGLTPSAKKFLLLHGNTNNNCEDKATCDTNTYMIRTDKVTNLSDSSMNSTFTIPDADKENSGKNICVISCTCGNNGKLRQQCNICYNNNMNSSHEVDKVYEAIDVSTDRSNNPNPPVPHPTIMKSGLVLGETVIKSVPTVTTVSEKVENDRVVRSIKFNDVIECRSPIPGRTFADAVKSPPLRRPLVPVNNGTATSPLAQPLKTPNKPGLSRQKSCSSFPVSRLFGDHRNPERSVSASRVPSTAERKQDRCNVEMLRRVGMPSMRDRPLTDRKDKPGYMQMTKTTSMRFLGTGRQSRADGLNNEDPGSATSRSNSNGLSRFRSKSTSKLNNKGWQF